MISKVTGSIDDQGGCDKKKCFLGMIILAFIYMSFIGCSEKKDDPFSFEGSGQSVGVGEVKWRRMINEGREEDAFDLLQKQLNNASASGNNTQEFYILKELGAFNIWKGYFDDASMYFNTAYRLAMDNNWLLKGAIVKEQSAYCQQRMGRYDDALEDYDIALEYYEEYNMAALRAGCMLYKSWIYREKLDYETAVSILEEGMALYRTVDNPDTLLIFYEDLGDTHGRFGYFDQAVKVFKEGLELAGIEGNNAMYLEFLKDIGYTNQMAENFEESRKYLLLAEEYYQKIKNRVMVTPRNAAQLLSFRAEYLIETGQFEKALEFLDDNGADMYRGMKDFHNFYRQRGEALLGAGRRKDACEMFLKAFSAVEEKRRTSTRYRSNFYLRSRGGGNIIPYYRLITLLAEWSLEAKNTVPNKELLNYGSDNAAGALYFAESVKARALLDILTSDVGSYYKSKLSSQLKMKEQNLFNRLGAAERTLSAVRSMRGRLYERARKKRDKVYNELQAFIRELRESHPLYAFIYYPRPMRVENLPLKPGEALIEYALLDDALYVFLVKKGKPVKVFKVAEADSSIKQQVEEYCRPFVRDPVTGELPYHTFSREKGKALYEKILAPVLAHVPEGDNLVIVPDGILALLPFEILVIETGKGLSDAVYLMDRRSVSYYQSASVMALNRMVKRPGVAKPLFALGSPVYSETDPRYVAFKQGIRRGGLNPQWDGIIGEYAFRGVPTRREWGNTSSSAAQGEGTGNEELVFSPLPESETEVRSIARIMGVTPSAPDILLNMDANESRFMDVPLGDYRFIHFATHADLPGRLKGVNEPFILLGQVENRRLDDGFLTLSEVADLELNAELVVLSACVTGRGMLRRGEGVANFAYAFHCAGAKSVVVTLWEVASLQAVEFMKTFYSQLGNGETKARSIAFARSELRKKYPNPFFWAPFVLHGERD